MALNISRDELIFNNDGTLDMRRKINKIWLQRQHNNQVISLKKEIRDLREKNMKQLKKCKDDLSAEITKMLLFKQKINKSGAEDIDIFVDDDDCNCAICMEPMIGITTLRCGHSMCADCFARHSRESNACPFCREEFSSKPKRIEPMSDAVTTELVNNWTEFIRPNYFEDMVNVNMSKRTMREKSNHLHYLVTKNAEIIIRNMVRPWYES